MKSSPENSLARPSSRLVLYPSYSLSPYRYSLRHAVESVRRHSRAAAADPKGPYRYDPEIVIGDGRKFVWCATGCVGRGPPVLLENFFRQSSRRNRN